MRRERSEGVEGRVGGGVGGVRRRKKVLVAARGYQRTRGRIFFHSPPFPSLLVLPPTIIKTRTHPSLSQIGPTAFVSLPGRKRIGGNMQMTPGR